MATISLRRFGGMAPSANDKTMEEHIAIYAKNINLRFSDFRPMPVAANVGAATAGSTLYRFEGNNAFITKAGEVSFVRGPIPTDTTERTYYTGDGLPKVTDLTNAIRQLGVPQPASAPTIAINKVDEYSREDSVSAQAASLQQMTDIVRANMVWAYTGLNNDELGAYFVATPRGWEFSFVIAGSMVDGAFVPTNPANFNLLDHRFGYYLETEGATTVAKVPITLRGGVLSFDATLEADLDALLDPSDNTKKLLTAEQRAAIAKALADSLAAANKKRDEVIQTLRTLKPEFETLANSATSMYMSDKAAVQAFYARAEVTNAISAAKTAVANTILNAAYTFNQAGWGGG